ncbi:MAG: hypothetical protein M3Y08_01210 [Fibrobacterota bacterium]|nr:hypothetical protein [Fibrobacterota bacterium]
MLNTKDTSPTPARKGEAVDMADLARNILAAQAAAVTRAEALADAPATHYTLATACETALGRLRDIAEDRGIESKATIALLVAALASLPPEVTK